MKNHQTEQSQQLERLFFYTSLSIDLFRQMAMEIDNRNTQHIEKKKSIIFPIIETLIIEEKFYEYFCTSYIKSFLSDQTALNINEKQILNFGYEILEEVFSRNEIIQNDNFVLSPILKKCNFDVFELIAMCKGYLRNPLIRREKTKSFFIQSFKKNNHSFGGIQRLCQFHQCLVQKSSSLNSFIIDKTLKQKSNIQLSYFLQFYSNNKDFFPSILQADNLIFKLMISIKLDTEGNMMLFERFKKQYFLENQFHLVTTCKNIRFMIQFFRNPFNQKVIAFYPQKNFIQMLAKYKQEDIDKIVSFSQVGLTWTEDQIFTCIGNIFKLGLTSITLSFLKSLLGLWLRNGLNENILKVIQPYISKIFIFMKHEKLFDVSLSFLKQFTLGPKNPTIGILNKLLQKLLSFVQKDCPLLKRHDLFLFMCLVQVKYEKVATLSDKLYIDLKSYLKNERQAQKHQSIKQEEVKEKLKLYEWEEVKVSLFGASTSLAKGLPIAQKQAGEYRGLYNIGNSCYMNSFLQCLYMNIEFRESILGLSTLALQKNVLQKMHESDEKKQKTENQIEESEMGNNKNKALMARQYIRPVAELQRLFAQLMKSKRPSINPIAIKNVSAAEFKNSFQQDTIEFGRSFLDTISRSSVENIFKGEQTNEIICPNCQKSRFNKEKFLDLMLTEVQEEQKSNDRLSNVTSQSGNGGTVIQKMLEKLFQQQQMEGLFCDFCQVKSQKSMKRHFLSKCPNYLILTMKLFCYDVKQNRNIKKHYNIDLKQGLIKVEGEMYQLYGIIVHRGQSANSGHYFSFCKEWRFKQNVEPKKSESQFQQSNERIMQDQNEKIKVQRAQKMQIQGEDQLQIQKSQQSSPNQMNQNYANLNKQSRWLCLNDSNISVFEQFQNVKEFLDLNQEDTPYILFYQKVSHVTSPALESLKNPIKLRQPLEKFIEKDDNEYLKFVQNKKKGNQNKNQVDWKNFGKVKGFTAYDFFKITKEDDDQRGNGFGGSGFGNTPII